MLPFKLKAKVTGSSNAEYNYEKRSESNMDISLQNRILKIKQKQFLKNPKNNKMEKV